MNSHTDFLEKKRFGSLDGLRAISIIAVIWHHTAPKWVGPVLGFIGTHGVTLFFAISGFLITTLLLRERERKGHIDLKAFYFRRILRIFPLYFGVLAIYIITVALFEQDVTVRKNFFHNLIYYTTYTSNIFVPLDGRVIFYFAWSLATEEQFYIIWPSLLYKTATTSNAIVVLVTVITACITDQLLGTRSFGIIPIAIVGGSLLAIMLHTQYGFTMLKPFLGRDWSAPLLMVIFIILLIITSTDYLIHFFAVLFVGACVIREDHSLQRLLSFQPLAYIGSISYGMYMLHMLCKNTIIAILKVLDWHTAGFEVFFLALVLTIAVSAMSFKYYESFFLKLKPKQSLI